MRRTVLSVMALACTAGLAGTVPAFADDTTPAPTSSPASSSKPVPTSTPAHSYKPVTTPVPTRTANPAAVPSQVGVVPKGAPDTGAAPVQAKSGVDGGLIGGSAAAVLAVGGGAVLLVRRRRATGA